MYLHRLASGLFLALINLFGIGMLVFGTFQNHPEYALAGGTCVLAVIAWLLVDAFFIPGMVRQANESGTPKNFVSLGAVNLDPSFSATLAKAGQNPTERKKRSAIPDGYEIPWRQEQPQATVRMYRNSEDIPRSDDA